MVNRHTAAALSALLSMEEPLDQAHDLAFAMLMATDGISNRAERSAMNALASKVCAAAKEARDRWLVLATECDLPKTLSVVVQVASTER
jgi:hypothetical protein